MQLRPSIKGHIAVCGCLFASATANAQTDPGSLERTRPQIEPVPTDRVAPKITAPALPTPSEAGIADTFILSAVVIEGATVFDSEELAKSFEPFLASRIGQAELVKIAQEITERYRNAGFLLSYAVVPRQSVQSGIVRIKVVEGFIARVRLVADARTAKAIRGIFQSLATERPLRIETLERKIGLGRDVRGAIITDVQISRSTNDPAEHLLTVVVGKDRFRGLAYADNRGTVTDARMRAYSSFSLASLAVPGDQLQVDLFAIPYEKFRYAYGQVKGSVPVGHDGLRIAASGSYGDQFQRVTGPNQNGMSRQLVGEISYPFIESRALSVAGQLQIGDLKSKLKQAGTVVQSDRIQVARAWLDISRAGPVRIDGRFGVSRGLDLDSATDRGDPLASRPFASSKFTKFNASLQVTAQLSDRLRLRIDSAGQISANSLLAPEEFALGGSRIGRAFDFNEITGDHGVAAMVELGYRPDGMGRMAKNLEVFAFVDGGGAFRKRSSPGLEKERWLASTGVGARFSAFGILWSSEIGAPIALDGADRGVRAFFSTTRIF